MSLELKNLTEEELNVLQSILNKLNPSGNTTTIANTVIVEPKEKRSRPKKVKKDTPVIQEEQEEQEEDLEQLVSKRSKKKQVKKQAKRPQKASRPCSTRPIIANPGKNNKFVKTDMYHANKADSVLDKKLWKGRKPTERRQDDGLVEIDCDRCGDTARVHPSLILRADKDITYVCDRCIGRK